MGRKSAYFEKGKGDFVLLCLMIIQALTGPLVAAAGVAGLCHWLKLDGRSISFWLLVAPVVYLVWVFLLLCFYVAETSLLSLFYEKPRRYDFREPRGLWRVIIAGALYGHGFILSSLPLAPFLSRAPGLSWLILRAYSPKAFVGRGVILAGDISDPDLTIIGAGVVIGEKCRIIAHSITRTPDGMMLFQSAPIELGENCTLGGGVEVEMGSKIGAGSVIEGFSRVPPFARIPPGEIWGGNPAVFRRKRTFAAENPRSLPEPPPAPAAFSAVATPADSDKLHRLIARALNVPPEQITAGTSAQNCLAWDSLGEMAIAAALHDQFGLSLPAEVFNRLNSVAAVEKALAGKAHKPVAARFLSLPADPELLPLLDPALVLAALGEQGAPFSGGAGKKIRVVIAATFVAQPLAPALELYCHAFGVEAEVDFFDFNQVPQALLSAESPLRQNREGLNVVLVRPEDWPGGSDDDRRVQAGQFLSAIKTFAATAGGALLVGDLPPIISAGYQESSGQITELHNNWRQQLASMGGVQILNFAGIIDELGRAAARPISAAGGTVWPFSPAVYQRLGIGIARALRQLACPPKKVLALDADNTLWGGVIGEDGMDGIQLGGDTAGRGFKALQAEVLALKARGILLVLVSKNTPEDVWNVLDHHPQMRLRRNDFAATRINWLPKSENLRALAAELNLGVDAFVLLDDNPAERLEVEAHCPGVTVVPLPSFSGSFAETLARLWCFDGAGETREDALRNGFTRQEINRRDLQQAAGELELYLRALELKVTLRGARPDDLPRVAQLLQKTNQFNLSLKRYTLPETRALLPAHDIWVLSVSDRFGDYGMTGVCITRPDNGSLFMDSFLMSCRTLGRGAETAFLHGIAQKARLAGASSLRGNFVPGPRNEPMCQFLEKSRFMPDAAGAYELDLERVPAAPEHLVLEIG